MIEKIIITAIDSKTNKPWNGSNYLEAVFAFYETDRLIIEMFKGNKWIPVEIEYKEKK